MTMEGTSAIAHGDRSLDVQRVDCRLQAAGRNADVRADERDVSEMDLRPDQAEHGGARFERIDGHQRRGVAGVAQMQAKPRAADGRTGQHGHLRGHDLDARGEAFVDSGDELLTDAGGPQAHANQPAPAATATMSSDAANEDQPSHYVSPILPCFGGWRIPNSSKGGRRGV